MITQVHKKKIDQHNIISVESEPVGAALRLTLNMRGIYAYPGDLKALKHDGKVIVWWVWSLTPHSPITEIVVPDAAECDIEWSGDNEGRVASDIVRNG